MPRWQSQVLFWKKTCTERIRVEERGRGRAREFGSGRFLLLELKLKEWCPIIVCRVEFPLAPLNLPGHSHNHSTCHSSVSRRYSVCTAFFDLLSHFQNLLNSFGVWFDLGFNKKGGFLFFVFLFPLDFYLWSLSKVRCGV